MNQLLSIHLWVRKDRVNKNGLLPIVIRLSLGNKRANIQPRMFVKAENWDPVKQRVRSKDIDSKIINSSLDIIKQKIWSIYQRLLLSDQFSLEEIMNVYANKKTEPSKGLMQLVQVHNDEFKRRLSIDRTESTYEKYLYTQQKVEAFVKYRYKKAEVPLTNINKKWVSDFYLFLRSEQNNQHNTAAKYIKNLKHIISYGVELGWLNDNPTTGFTCGYKETKQEILGPEELERIMNKQFSIPRLELARKLFVLQCLTGLSFKDLINLQKNNICEGPDGKPWLILRRSKTDTEVRFPILKPAIRIITELTIDSNVNDPRLFPMTLCNQRMNSYLKEIADACLINKNLTTHVGRRTMASTVLLANGVNIEVVSKILAHKRISTTQIYAKVADTYISKTMDQIEKKLT